MLYRSYFVFRGEYKNKAFMNKITVTNILRASYCSKYPQST